MTKSEDKTSLLTKLEFWWILQPQDVLLEMEKVGYIFSRLCAFKDKDVKIELKREDVYWVWTLSIRESEYQVRNIKIAVDEISSVLLNWYI